MTLQNMDYFCVTINKIKMTYEEDREVQLYRKPLYGHGLSI